MEGGRLDKGLFEGLLAKYIEADTVLVYLNSQNAVHCKVSQAYQIVADFLPQGQVKMADPRFNGRVIIDPIGVGVGQKL